MTPNARIWGTSMRRRFLAWLYWRSSRWENGRPPFRVFYQTFDEVRRKREAGEA